MLYSKIKTQIENLDLDLISAERKTVLQPLVDFIQLKTDAKAAINLNFICTHNSRRSHLSQVWAQAMAHYYVVNEAYSAIQVVLKPLPYFHQLPKP